MVRLATKIPILEASPARSRTHSPLNSEEPHFRKGGLHIFAASMLGTVSGHPLPNDPEWDTSRNHVSPSERGLAEPE